MYCTSLERVLADLGAAIIAVNRDNGWDVATPASWDEKYKIPSVLALIHSEVSEALEAYRNHDKELFVEELADVAIRLFDLTHGLGISLAPAILDKVEKNRGRGFRHGGKKV